MNLPIDNIWGLTCGKYLIYINYNYRCKKQMILNKIMDQLIIDKNEVRGNFEKFVYVDDNGK